MTINGYDLNSFSNFSKIKLISGKNGLYKHISKPYVCTTTNIRPWITGSELLFIPTYLLKLKNEPILKIIKDSIDLGVYGVVIISNDNNINEFIKKISKQIIDLSNKNELPLCIMPYSLKLSDIVDDIYMLIISHYGNIDQKKFILKNLIFNKNNDFVYDNLNNSTNYFDDNYKFGYIGLLSSDDNKILNDLKDFLKICIIDNIKLVYFDFFNKIVFLLTSNSINRLNYYNSIFNDKCKEYIECTNKYNFSIGKYISNMHDIQYSYSTAIKVNNLINKKILPTHYLEYKDVSVLIDILEYSEKNQQFLNNCSECISGLLYYDKKNNTELLETLYYYLLYNSNIVETSKRLFVHRNTVTYRKKIIENILSVDLNSTMKKIKLCISIQVCLYNGIIEINFK